MVESAGKLALFALQRDKVTIPLYTLPEKKVIFLRGGGKNFCNFVALCVKPILELHFRRYKTRYKKIILSRCVYE